MKTYPVVLDAIARSRKDDFAIIHFAAESTHLHLLIEASSTIALSKGMQGLNTRITRAVNKLHHRRGTIWDDRYHLHALKSPTEMRNALAYVLLNHQHHSPGASGIDPCSSGYWHPDWHAAPEGPPPVSPPRTWLAAHGWRRAGRFLPSPNRY